MKRVRITYRKTAPLRYTGNLDIQKIWERFLRRAKLPVAYSQGYHPQPRIQQAAPLPLGFLSDDEKVDVYLDGDQAEPDWVSAQLAAAPYPGIEILQIDSIDNSEPTLTTRVRSAEYRAEFLDPVDTADLERRVTHLLDSTELIRSRRGKNYDLRPLIETLVINHFVEQNYPSLLMQLASRQGATGRPEEVVSTLGYDPFSARYIRTRLFFQTD